MTRRTVWFSYIQMFQIFLVRTGRRLKDIGSLKYKLHTEIVRMGVKRNWLRSSPVAGLEKLTIGLWVC